MDVSLELRLVEVAESQVGLDTILLLILDRGKIEREHVGIKKFLLYHFIEYGGHTSLSKSWVGQSYDSLEVRAGKDSVLLLDLAELLVLNMNLSA